MKRLLNDAVPQGTPEGLIRAAAARARMAARWRRSAGEDDAMIRQGVLARFREFIDAEGLGAYTDESVMAAARQAIEEVLRERPAHRPDR